MVPVFVGSNPITHPRKEKVIPIGMAFFFSMGWVSEMGFEQCKSQHAGGMLVATAGRSDTKIYESLTHAYECERKKKRQTFGPVFLFYGVSTVAWNYFTVMYLASKEGMVILAPKTVV